ncbi:unnamed protein product [Prorocentrum cordatum]|uniref:Uncharacterized protein n=1 Tax=Prorocentrum cordatum TaxID=2364126 RepID=A0ABN9UJS3_9DINO|nr:unnamed protein product [Polarella glacialis]
MRWRRRGRHDEGGRIEGRDEEEEEEKDQALGPRHQASRPALGVASRVALDLVMFHAWPRPHWRSAAADATAAMPLPDGEEDVLASPVPPAGVPASAPWPVAAALRSPGGRRTRCVGAAAARSSAARLACSSAARLGCAPKSTGLPKSQSSEGGF